MKVFYLLLLAAAPGAMAVGPAGHGWDRWHRPRPPQPWTECFPAGAESCVIGGCQAFRKDIAVYAECHGTATSRQTCVLRHPWYPDQVQEQTNSRELKSTSRYWYKADDALAEARSLLQQQGCRN